MADDKHVAGPKIGLPLRELPPEDYERIEDLVDFAPLRAGLAEALETLAVDQREALKLRVIDGLPYPRSPLACSAPRPPHASE